MGEVVADLSAEGVVYPPQAENHFSGGGDSRRSGTGTP